jgi:integrase
MIEDMQLRGLAPATQRAYLGAIQQLACHYGTSPDQLSEEAIRRYFLFLYQEKHISRSTATVTLCAIKFLFEQTLRRTFALFDLMRPGTDQKLPVVLTPDETWRILALVRKPAYQACLSTIYTCGLRISEGIDLQVSHIDSARMSLHIHAGKGNKDRLVPLPARTLTLLRTQWQTHRNPVWIFPAADRGDIASSTASTPIDAVTVRRAFSAAVSRPIYFWLFRTFGDRGPESVYSLQ